jgi:hypothetical protein
MKRFWNNIGTQIALGELEQKWICKSLSLMLALFFFVFSFASF